MSRVAQPHHMTSAPHALKLELRRAPAPPSPGGAVALPTSVRGAPPELRRMIRKRQNSESAKRCRQRKKIENARTADEIVTQAAKVQRLEAVVQHLASRLAETQAVLAAIASRPTPTPPAPSPAPPAVAQPVGTVPGGQDAMWTHGAEGLHNMQMVQSMPRMPGGQALQGVAGHTKQLQMALAAGIDDIAGGGWQ